MAKPLVCPFAVRSGSDALAPAQTDTGAVTVMVTLAVLEPPGPVQTMVKTVVCARTTDLEPDNARLPDQPPEAVTAVAFEELHVRVELPPCAIDIGLAESTHVGTGAGGAGAVTVTVALSSPSP